MAPYAFPSNRSASAKQRNYSTCMQCKDARQKCKILEEGICERCNKLGKECSLSQYPSTDDLSPDMNTRVVTAQRTLADQDNERFGCILYQTPYNNGNNVLIVHVRAATDGSKQVYQTKCDRDHRPVALPEYLGPLDEYTPNMRQRVSEVRIEDMLDVMEEYGLAMGKIAHD